MKEFVENLRETADIFKKSGCAVDGIVKDYRKAADMIEKLCGENNIGGFVEKLIERLEELKEIEGKKCDKYAKLNMGDYVETYNHGEFCYLKAIQIVNQLAEEYNSSKSKSLEKQPEEPQTNFYSERFNRVI